MRPCLVTGSAGLAFALNVLGALGLVAGLGCTPGGGSSGGGGDCRLAAQACAPGFTCVPDGDGFACERDPGQPDAGGQGGAGGGQGGAGGQAGQGGAGGAGGQGGAPVDDLVDISGVRIDAPLTEDGTAFVVHPSQRVPMTFDWAIRQSADCESCRAQILVEYVGQYLLCIYDGSPGLAGETGRLEGELAIPDGAMGRAEVRWHRTEAADCDAAAGALGGPSGVLATVEARPALGPYTFISPGRINIPGDGAQHCFNRECPAGTVPLVAGGDIGGEHDLVTDRAVGDRQWQRCFVAERVGVPVREARFSVLCAEAPGAEVLRIEVTEGAGADRLTTVRADCPEGFRAVHGGGAWPRNWQVLSRVMDGPRFEITGQGASGEVTAQVICVAGIPAPVVVRDEIELAPGGQCGGVDCPEGHRAIGGGAILDRPLDLEVFGLNNFGFNVCGVNAQRPSLTIEISAQCVPFQ